MTRCVLFRFFFFNDTATTEIYTLSLHDALPISRTRTLREPCDNRTWTVRSSRARKPKALCGARRKALEPTRSEEHTSELQSQSNLVCRLLLEKKKPTYMRCNRPWSTKSFRTPAT